VKLSGSAGASARRAVAVAFTKLLGTAALVTGGAVDPEPFHCPTPVGPGFEGCDRSRFHEKLPPENPHHPPGGGAAWAAGPGREAGVERASGPKGRVKGVIRRGWTPRNYRGWRSSSRGIPHVEAAAFWRGGKLLSAFTVPWPTRAWGRNQQRRRGSRINSQ